MASPSSVQKHIFFTHKSKYIQQPQHTYITTFTHTMRESVCPHTLWPSLRHFSLDDDTTTKPTWRKDNLPVSRFGLISVVSRESVADLVSCIQNF